MATDVQGSATVSVGPSSFDIAALNRKMSIREAGNGTTEDEIFFDVFPSSSQLDVSSTSGSVGNSIERVEPIFEILNFNNSDIAQLTHGEVQDLTLTKLGDYRNSSGNLLFSTISYDADTSTVKLNQPVFGNIKATYNAPFRRYPFKFSGSCPINRPPIDSFSGEEEEIFVRATIIAKLPESLGLQEAIVSLSLFNSNDRCSFLVDAGEVNTIKLELGKTGFHKKAKLTNPNYFTRINVFPALRSLGSVDVDSGESGRLSFCKTDSIVIKNEFVGFNKSISGTIRYPLTTAFTAEPQTLTDEFGDIFPATEANIAHVGSTVNIGTWKRNNVFVSSGEKRKVKKGEIYVTDNAQNAKPVFGVVKCNYTATIDVYLYKHEVVVESDGSGIVSKLANADVFTIRQNDLVGILPIPGKFILYPNFEKPTQDCEF